MRKVLLAALLGIVCIGIGASNAKADFSFQPLFKSKVVGIEVAEQVVAGIPGGQPWVVEDGKAKIVQFGGFQTLFVDVDGLLLLNGTVGPVFEVIASVHCSTGGPGEEAFTEVARSQSRPLSAEGDATIFDFIAIEDQCAAPIVLVRVSVIDAGFVGGTPGEPLALEDIGVTPPWIAASGL